LVERTPQFDNECSWAKRGRAAVDGLDELTESNFLDVIAAHGMQAKETPQTR
jgi:hypothetical protein